MAREKEDHSVFAKGSFSSCFNKISSFVGVRWLMTPNRQGSVNPCCCFSLASILLNRSGSIRNAVLEKILVEEIIIVNVSAHQFREHADTLV